MRSVRTARGTRAVHTDTNGIVTQFVRVRESPLAFNVRLFVVGPGNLTFFAGKTRLKVRSNVVYSHALKKAAHLCRFELVQVLVQQPRKGLGESTAEVVADAATHAAVLVVLIAIYERRVG